MAYTKTPSSGMQNIKTTPEGSSCVIVGGKYLGTFKKLDLAIKVRNEYRSKHNLVAATDIQL